MTAAKANEVGRRFPHRDKLPPVVLVFGPDRGLVTEVSDAILALFDDSDDPFAIVKLDAATVTADPARLRAKPRAARTHPTARATGPARTTVRARSTTTDAPRRAAVAGEDRAARARARPAPPERHHRSR